VCFSKKNLFSKIYPHRSRPSCATLRRAFATTVFLVVHPISRRAPAAAHRVPSPLPLSHPRAQVLLGSAEVLPTPSFPTRRSWPLSTPWPPQYTTTSRRCCDENTCCKRMFKCFRRFRGMLRLFHMDVAKVDRGMLHMLQVL